jgi:hypothetical protein
MIQVTFDPQNLTDDKKSEWEDLQKEAEAATQRIIQAWEDGRQKGSRGSFPDVFEEKVWGKIKTWLLKNVFNNKCAYCETRQVRAPYHAEHYRPKGRVRVKSNKGLQVCIIKDEYNQVVEHPGYFWLAYHWLNLLPSCNDCNSAKGKNDQFPVKKNHSSVRRLSPSEVDELTEKRIKSLANNDIYYLQPNDLNILEEPLLLHPYIDNPDEHIVFGDFGVVVAREDSTTGMPSEKGLHSIQVYNLADEDLRIARQTAQENVFMEYGNAFTSKKNLPIPDKVNTAKSAIQGYINNKEPYSAAVIGYLRLVFPSHGL